MKEGDIMKIKQLRAVFVFIVILCVAGVSLLPASVLLDDQLASHKRVSVSSITGYWWQGEMNDLAVDYRGYRVDLGSLRWKFDWLTLPSLRWCIQGANSASKDWVKAQLRLCYLLLERRVQMVDTVIDVDAQTLAEVSGIEIAGQWRLHITTATIENNRLVGIYGEAIWRHAQWHNGERWFVLGDILSTFDSTQQSTIEVNTSDIDGPLQMELTTVFSAQQEWAVTGFIEPYGKLPVSLAESLALVSSRASGKRYYFDYQGH
jgi:hypothetical protein